MSNETSKATRRRYVEDRTGVFPWWSIFQGEGLDVGSGHDKLMFPGCQPFDIEHGDAEHILDTIEPESLDYLHSSQCLEHMTDPYHAFTDWVACVRPRGHLIVTVPDWCLYEKMTWPSPFNPDHKSTWSTSMKGSHAPMHVYVPDFLRHFDYCTEIRLLRVVDTNFNYNEKPTVDQTWVECNGTEAFIEFVLRKK